MKNKKFNYPLEDRNLLMESSLYQLKKKSVEISRFYGADYDCKEHIEKENSLLYDMKFDGYMLLLQDIVCEARNRGIYISCFGSIQYSFISYLLGITEHYNFRGFEEFVNFTPFEKTPTVNIIISSPQLGEIFDYIIHKYNHLIEKTKEDKKIKFKDNLTLKFIDLGVDKKFTIDKKNVENIGLKILPPNINTSLEEATIAKENKLLLGLNSTKLGSVGASKVVMTREEFSSIKDYNDLVKKNPFFKNMEKSAFDGLFDKKG